MKNKVNLNWMHSISNLCNKLKKMAPDEESDYKKSSDSKRARKTNKEYRVDYDFFI